MRANYKKHQATSVLNGKVGRMAILEEYEKTCEFYEILFLYAMNHDEKSPFGKKRLTRIYKKMQQARDELREYYSADDFGDSKIDLYAMKKELERKGIAPEQLEKASKTYEKKEKQ